MSVKTEIRPATGPHAIEVAALAIEWQTQLTDDMLALASDLYESLADVKKFLPRKQSVNQIAFQFGVGGGENSMQATVPAVGGFDFLQLLSSGKIAWSLSVRRDYLTCNCAVYDRWANVKPAALGLLKPFVELFISKGAAINALGLQYQDSFTLVNGELPGCVEDLIRKETSLLPADVFSRPSLWHMHQGWYSVGVKGRAVLNTFNVDLVQPSKDPVFTINGQHRLLGLAEDRARILEISVAELEEGFDWLHQENKTLLHDLLTDSVLEKIGLHFKGG